MDKYYAATGSQLASESRVSHHRPHYPESARPNGIQQSGSVQAANGHADPTPHRAGNSGEKHHLIFVIQRMTHQLAIALERGELGVDQAEAHVLAFLSENGDATVTDIHRMFGHKRSTLTSVLDRLQGKQLVERVVNEADRRSFIIRLTPNGRVIARNVQNYMRRLEREIEDQLSEEQLNGMDAISRAITRMVTALG